MKKIILICILIFFSSFTYSVDMENIVDGNMDIQINRVKEEFFPLYIDEVKEIGYIPLSEFLYVAELNDIEINFEKKQVNGVIPNGQRIKWEFDPDISFVKAQELYIDVSKLSAVMPVEKLVFDLPMLNINIKLPFKLPSDMRYEQEQKRRGMGSEREKDAHDVIGNKKMFSPGVVEIEYEKTNLNEGKGKSLDINYSTQLMYGELDSEFSIYDDSRKNKSKPEIDSISLTYENVMDKKDVVLGSFYMRTPSFYDVDNNINGISILDSSERFDVTEKDGNIFEGYAPTGSVVELYRNGILIDYQNVENQRYRFENINTQSLTDKYYIRIYKTDGTYIQKDLSLWLNNKNLSKNTWNYSIQSGKVDRKGDNDFIGTLKYGLNNFMTAEVGYYNLAGKSEERKKYDEMSYGMYINSPPVKFPFWANIIWYQDREEGDGTLTWEYRQNFYDFIIEGIGEKYSRRISEEEKKDEKYRANIRKSFGRLNIGTGYEVETYQGNHYTDYIGSVGYNQRYLSNTLEYRFQEYSDDVKRNRHITRFQTGISYFDNINIVTEVELKYDNNWEVLEDKYSVKFIRRNNGYYSKKYFDLSLGVTYSTKDDDRLKMEMNGTVYLEDFGVPFVDTEISFDASDEKGSTKKVGTKFRKILILEDIERNSRLKNKSNSWVSGKVYIDNNANSRFDVEDEVLPDIKVSILGKSIETDADGNYLIEDISSNAEFNVRVDRTYIDPLLYYDEEKYYKLMPSTGMKIDIPFQNTISLSGNVIVHGENIDVESLPYIFNKIKIVIKNGDKEVKSLKPEFDGYFIVDGLIEGNYTVELSSRDELYKPMKNKIEITIKPDEIENGIFEMGKLIFTEEI